MVRFYSKLVKGGLKEYADENYQKRAAEVTRQSSGKRGQAGKALQFGFHAIGHITASILYNKGIDKAIIQQILRHKRASTTDIYLRSLGLEVDFPTGFLPFRMSLT